MKRVTSGLLIPLALALAPWAEAQVTSSDASCRAAIQKSAGKLGTTANKAIDACIKAQLTSPSGPDCNQAAPGNPVTDAKGKIGKAAAKLSDAVAAKCPANPGALAEFPSCPSPANADDDGGSTTGVDNFGEVADCATTLNTTGVVTVRRHILVPDAAAIAALANGDDIAKCANAIAKNSTKLWKTVFKTRGKCQAQSDKAGGPYDYGCSTDDGGGKVTDTIQKTKDAIQAACGDSGLTGPELGLIHTCATDATAIGDCVTNAVVKNAGGLTATAFEFAGVCPASVRVELNSGTGPGALGRLNNTRLDSGFNGLHHGADFYDDLAGRVDLSCSGPDCESCTVTSPIDCSSGHCRCSSNPSLQCNAPFTQDVCAAGQTCVVHLAPPLPVSAGGSPLCVVPRVTQALTGTADAGVGSSSTEVEINAVHYLGISQSQPCPKCSATTVGATGMCVGGANNGAPCTTHAVHPDFGPTSYHCQPPGASQAGGLATVQIVLTDGVVALPFGDQCDAPFGSLMCACGVCSGNQNVTCNSDAECASGGLGTCEKGGSGASRRPNPCQNVANCVDIGGEHGECQGATETSDGFCSGLVRRDGSGLLTCSAFDSEPNGRDDDCEGLDAECGGNCGNCTLTQPKRCFLDPVEATGLAGQDGAELVSTFCLGTLSSAGKNAAFGLPGAGRMVLDLDFTAFCADGTTEWEMGGSNCP